MIDEHRHWKAVRLKALGELQPDALPLLGAEREQTDTEATVIVEQAQRIALAAVGKRVLGLRSRHRREMRSLRLAGRSAQSRVEEVQVIR